MNIFVIVLILFYYALLIILSIGNEQIEFSNYLIASGIYIFSIFILYFKSKEKIQNIIIILIITSILIPIPIIKTDKREVNISKKAK